MSDYQSQMEVLARRAGARATVVLERSGIDVASWGDADSETAAAEFGELWRQLRTAGAVRAPGELRSLEIVGSEGAWVAVPVGEDYVLALLTGPGIAPGRARFFAGEWAATHRGEFA